MARIGILLVGIALSATMRVAAQDPASRDRPRVEVGGMLLVNGFYTDVPGIHTDLPITADPGLVAADNLDRTGVRITQSRLTVRTRGPLARGVGFDAEIDVDFFAGSSEEPTPRLRRAVVRLSWPNAWLVVGQEAAPLSPVEPSSFATVAIPGFTGAGNLSRWLPQARLGVETSGAIRFGIEASALAPVTTLMHAGEAVHRPYLEARAVVRWGRDTGAGIISAGVHQGWIGGYGDTLVSAQAVAVAMQIAFSTFLELRAEGFLGEATELFAPPRAHWYQVITTDDVPIQSKGGWVQLLLRPHPEWELGGGYGIDDPSDEHVQRYFGPLTPRLKNAAWEVHAHWRPGPLVLAGEYRRIETTYLSGALAALQPLNHVNVAMGVVF